LLSFVKYLLNDRAVSASLRGSKLISAQFDETIASLLVNGQAHSYSLALDAINKPISPRHVAQVYDYILARAESAITSDDLTRISGVSSRALYEGFRRFKGVSPMACLKGIRLERARQDLLEGAREWRRDPDRAQMGLQPSRAICSVLSEGFRRKAFRDEATAELIAGPKRMASTRGSISSSIGIELFEFYTIWPDIRLAHRHPTSHR
jgi:AraC-like DNA-binding protein